MAGITPVIVTCSAGNNRCADDVGVALAAVFGLVAGAAGTGFGALIGSFIHTEKWREVPVGSVRAD